MDTEERSGIELEMEYIDKCTSLIKNTNDNLTESLVSLSNLIPNIDGKCTTSKPHVELVVEGLNKISHSASTIPEGSWQVAILSGVMGALVASLSAFLFNSFYLNRRNKNNKKSHFGSSSIELLDEFEGHAVNYWMNDSSTLSASELEVMEVRIKNLFFVLSSNLNLFSESLAGNSKHEKDSIDQIINNVFDISTGGGFEVFGRPKDVSRANQLSQLCAKLKSILMRHSYWET